jgi:hypothetical protein
MATDCLPCKAKTTRVLLRSKEFTDAEYDLIRKTLIETANYIEVQASGTILALKTQRKILESKIIKTLVDTTIYSGNLDTANKIIESLKANGIDSYVRSPQKI